MTQLPVEILHSIFKQLPLVQKLECMFVCRQWALIIGSSFLFNMVQTEEYKLLDKLIRLIEAKPNLGSQVETMKLDISRTLYFDIAKFLVLFPNLICIDFCFENEFDPEDIENSDDWEESNDSEAEADLSNSNDSNDSNNSIDTSDTSDTSSPDASSQSGNNTDSPIVSSFFGIYYQQESSFIPALIKTKSKLKTIIDYRNLNLTRLLITNGLCPGLVSLTLNRYDNESNQDIFFILKDLPVLKHLKIDHFPFSLYFLETIHTNVPSLESLDLRSLDLLPSTCPATVLPASPVSRLTLDTSNDGYEPGEPAEWLRYVALKYPNLKYFNHNFETCGAYNEIMPLLVRNCGSSLISLAFQSSMDPDFSVLRSVNTHTIKELKIEFHDDALSYPMLEQTECFIHLSKLKLQHILPTRNLEKLKEIVDLKSLDIYFINPQEYEPTFEYREEDHGLDIYTLFKSFPSSLQSISIKNAHLVFNYDNDEEYNTKFRHIKTFKLDMISLKTLKLDDFISKCLPKLRTLQMNEVYDFTPIFSIPDLHLSYLGISSYQCDDRYQDCCLMTKDGPRFYSFHWKARKNYSGLSGWGLPKGYNEMNLKKIMVVICGSVERLELFGREMYLVSDRDNFKSLF